MCHVTRDEFCYFLDSRCTYVHESGEVIEIMPETPVFFPQDWGRMHRLRHDKRLYMIR
ncbi:hypothetical protein NKH09_30510 [Mesorhizobium sp. M1339]